MRHDTQHRRLPRAGLDRIDDPVTAFTAIAMAIERPLRAEIVLLLLDTDHFGRAIVVVTGTTDPNAVVSAVECIVTGVHAEELGAIVVASIRPDGSCADGDVDRWLEMSDLSEQAGVELLEWFVVGRDVRCPRDDLGETPRW